MREHFPTKELVEGSNPFRASRRYNLRKDYAYSYILGLYLGDGYINKEPRTNRLRIFMNMKRA